MGVKSILDPAAIAWYLPNRFITAANLARVVWLVAGLAGRFVVWHTLQQVFLFPTLYIINSGPGILQPGRRSDVRPVSVGVGLDQRTQQHDSEGK